MTAPTRFEAEQDLQNVTATETARLLTLMCYGLNGEETEYLKAALNRYQISLEGKTNGS